MSQQELNVNLLTETMRASVTEVFGTMLGIGVEPSEPTPGFVVEAGENGVVSLLGLTGDWAGSAGLCCSSECACWFASQMLFSEYPELNDEVRDAVGEIANMVIGNFKNGIGSETGPLGMSTPTVICGHEMTTTNSGHRWMVFPFRTEKFSFQTMVLLQPAKQGSAHEHHPHHAFA